MTDRATGIRTVGATDYVATFLASEQAEGHNRVIQLIAMTAGKIDTAVSRLNVASNDSTDVTSTVGSLLTGDNRYIAAYIQHSQSTGSCLLTPLLCDFGGAVIGYLSPKVSSVQMPTTVSGKYLSTCLSWEVMSTGAYYVYPFISNLSSGNSVDIYAYTF